MSLLVTIRKYPRVCNGVLVKPGESVRLPNSLAIALEAKGRAAWPTEKVALEAAEKKQKRKARRRKAKKAASADA